MLRDADFIQSKSDIALQRKCPKTNKHLYRTMRTGKQAKAGAFMYPFITKI